jgi:hypothetical protein
MSNSDPNKITSNKSDGRTGGGFLGFLRAMALILLFIGAAGSLGFMFRAGQHTPGSCWYFSYSGYLPRLQSSSGRIWFRSFGRS